ncbi:RNase P modulator RnpM [Gemella sp. zg-570]|uniref:RNase P modulator RnpM n=1 Tax=unclassified Gemella TaxID=2624949 RepID=UPI001C05B7C0|nr:YlxR family protein [Gemella sp. zg-570]MBU0278550.1 YlxR family protein [Gemella sp. zg-1178]QWQ39415.1 YlxR family protein [Gemella sp. zg-570]
MKKKKIPQRKCILTNEMLPKKELIRIVKNKDGEISVDNTGKKSGRGAYVVADIEVVEAAQKKNKLEKFFEASQEEMQPIYAEVIRLIYRKLIPQK